MEDTEWISSNGAPFYSRGSHPLVTRGSETLLTLHNELCSDALAVATMYYRLIYVPVSTKSLCLFFHLLVAVSLNPSLERARVTSLAEFSPVGWLFTFGSFVKITEAAHLIGLLFPR
jgi:hypothetical protein